MLRNSVPWEDECACGADGQSPYYVLTSICTDGTRARGGSEMLFHMDMPQNVIPIKLQAS